MKHTLRDTILALLVADGWQTPPAYAGYPQVPSQATAIERIRGNVQVIYDELE